MKKGNTYTFKQIENFGDENNFGLFEYGSNTVGRNFVMLDHQDKDCCISFVLTGSNSQGHQYECIYANQF